MSTALFMLQRSVRRTRILPIGGAFSLARPPARPPSPAPPCALHRRRSTSGQRFLLDPASGCNDFMINRENLCKQQCPVEAIQTPQRLRASQLMCCSESQDWMISTESSSSSLGGRDLSHLTCSTGVRSTEHRDGCVLTF